MNWQHFVIPLAEFAVQHLLQLQVQQQQQQQEGVNAAAVWDFLEDLLLEGRRGPQPGGCLLLWSAQEALRPLIAHKAEIRNPRNPKP